MPNLSTTPPTKQRPRGTGQAGLFFLLSLGFLAVSLLTAMLPNPGIAVATTFGIASIGTLLYSISQADSLREGELRLKAQQSADAVLAQLHQQSVNISPHQEAALAQAVYRTAIGRWTKHLNETRKAEAVNTTIALLPF